MINYSCNFSIWPANLLSFSFPFFNFCRTLILLTNSAVFQMGIFWTSALLETPAQLQQEQHPEKHFHQDQWHQDPSYWSHLLRLTPSWWSIDNWSFSGLTFCTSLTSDWDRVFILRAEGPTSLRVWCSPTVRAAQSSLMTAGSHGLSLLLLYLILLNLILLSYHLTQVKSLMNLCEYCMSSSRAWAFSITVSLQHDLMCLLSSSLK